MLIDISLADFTHYGTFLHIEGYNLLPLIDEILKTAIIILAQGYVTVSVINAVGLI